MDLFEHQLKPRCSPTGCLLGNSVPFGGASEEKNEIRGHGSGLSGDTRVCILCLAIQSLATVSATFCILTPGALIMGVDMKTIINIPSLSTSTSHITLQEQLALTNRMWQK